MSNEDRRVAGAILGTIPIHYSMFTRLYFAATVLPDSDSDDDAERLV
jgi:hypothetical protein